MGIQVERDASGRFGDQYDQQICEMYEAGFSLGWISRYFGIGKESVRKRVVKQGIRVRPRSEAEIPDRLTHLEFERTRFLYEKLEMGTPEIAEALGRTKSTVNYRLVRAGVKLRDRHESQVIAARKGRKKVPNRSKERRPHVRIGTKYDRRIIRMYKAGHNQEYIERALDLPHGAVGRRLRANNVPIRPKKGTPIAKKLPRSELERTAFLYAGKKLTLSQVADRLRISPTAVKYRLEQAGMPLRDRSEGQKVAYRNGTKVLSGEPLRRIEAKRARNNGAAPH